MPDTLNVVVHLTDGTLVKGSTQDFSPDRPSFRVVLPNGRDTRPVKTAETKAVFFVRQLDGTGTRVRARSFSSGDVNRTNGRPVAVLFRDGELLLGYSLSFNPERQGFFMLPADGADNNIRIFVVRRAVQTLKFGPDAEAFVRARLDPPQAA